MAGSTIMTAKNSFLEGLIMDFAPDNTQANCMTSALNATLLTFNGNEMQLQNDMGNGRVETAYLPDGYMPVGTCEFGDIVYIISYNPLTDKAQIGCFPSPERNISSEELQDVPQDSGISASDFQVLNNNQPTGELKASSVKKVLFQNKLHPGDKYIIASLNLKDNSNNISAYGSTSYDINDFPKLVKIHIVSIDDSGKITYLDSAVKWYDEGPYFISKTKNEAGINTPDIDSYRDLLNSGYSIFKSKTSGQLALLVELEKITGFGCTWECYKEKEELNGNQKEITYGIYLNINWNTNHNDINPNGAVIEGNWTKSNKIKGWRYGRTDSMDNDALIRDVELTVNKNIVSEILISRHYEPENISGYNAYLLNKYDTKIEGLQDKNKITLKQNINGIPDLGKYIYDCYSVTSVGNTLKYLDKDGKEITTSVTLVDSLVNNYFNYPVTKKLGTFTIPVSTTLDITENDKTTKYKRDNDLSGLIYNYKITPTMPYGKLDEFTVNGYIDFSKIGRQHIKLHTWKYYNSGGNSTLTWGMDAYTDTGFVVRDVILEFYNDTGKVASLSHPDYTSYNGQFTDIILLDRVNTFGKWSAVTDGTDGGKLLSNSLYLVKIIVKQGVKTMTGEIVDREGDDVIEYRWLWTNEMFNKYYYAKLDYDSLKIELNLDCDIKFKQNVDTWKCTTDNISSGYLEQTSQNTLHNTFSANVQTVAPNINNVSGDVSIKLQYDYGTFTLSDTNKFKIILYEGIEQLVNYPEKPQMTYSGEKANENNYIYPTLATVENNKVITESPSGNLWDSDENYKKFKSTANLKITNSVNANTSSTDTDKYISSMGKVIDLKTLNYLEKTNQNINSTIDLQFSTTHYSKYYYTTNFDYGKCTIMRSCIYGDEDLENYNLYHEQGKVFFKYYVFGHMLTTYDYGDDKIYRNVGSFKRTNSSKTINSSQVISVADYYYLNESGGQTWSLKDVIYNRYKNQCGSHSNNIKFVFPFIFGWDESQLPNDYSGLLLSTAKHCGYLAYAYMHNRSNSSCVKRRTDKFKDETMLWWWRKSADRSGIGESEGERLYNNVSASNVIKKSYLCFKQADGSMQPAANEYIDDDDNINKVLSLLTQVYYNTGTVENKLMYYKDNFIYLTDNYTSYTRDVVTKIISTNPGLTLNNKGPLNLSENGYIKTILKKVGININQISNFNYTIELKLCIKSFPILFKIDYIKPYIEPKDLKAQLKIEGMTFNSNPKLEYSNVQHLNTSELYYLNDKNLFVPLLQEIKLPLYKFTNFDFANNRCTATNTGKFIKIDNMVNCLSINNGALQVKDLDSPTNSTSIDTTGMEYGTGYISIGNTEFLKTVT